MNENVMEMQYPKIKAESIHYMGENEIILAARKLDPEENKALRMILRSKREHWHKFITPSITTI
jgi:hypothetical protein